MKIVIFGLAGTGTSTAGKLLAKELNYSFMSTGNIMRAKAEELVLSLYEFDELCKKDERYDLELDKSVEVYGKENDNFIFESRLAWYFIPNAIKIKFVCEEGETYRRVSEREEISFEEAKQKTLSRQKSVQERYKTLYPQISFPPKDEFFDLVIDTTSISPEEIIVKIKEFIFKN